jgi:hypothetical protein
MEVEEGLTLGRIPHALPFQCSVKVLISVLVAKMPTAKQLLALGHDTLESPDCSALLGFGLGSVDHALPFQCSISVNCVEPTV